MSKKVPSPAPSAPPSFVSNINIPLVAHIVVESLVIGVVTYWLHNKISTVNAELVEIKKMLQMHQAALNEIYGNRPVKQKPPKKSKEKKVEESEDEEDSSSEESSEESEKKKKKK